MVIGIAVFTFVVWMIVGGELAFTHALLTSITVLGYCLPLCVGVGNSYGYHGGDRQGGRV